MKIKFNGPIQFGNRCRCGEGYHQPDASVLINGIDVVSAIHNAKFSGPVTIAISDERFSGDLVTELGWGYSEWTPMDPDVLKIGEHDLLDILNRYSEGCVVTMWVSDEPINVLED